MAVGDRAQASAAARYPLSRESAPDAFARADDAGGGDGATTAGKANAMWLGSDVALEQLGLERGTEVVDEMSALVLQGRHAVTGDQVRRPGSRLARQRDGEPRLDDRGKPYQEAVVNSYDLTFSAPKSVSVLWSQADSALRTEIEHSMMVAANAMLEHVTRTRPVVGGKELGHGFAAATALQVTARAAEGEKAPSPQLHVHCHLVGVLDKEGKVRTPEGSALFKNSAPREGGAVGRAVLARELEKLGFQIRARTGRSGRYFEIDGVPEGLCGLFSGRTRDVDRWIREREAAVGGRLMNRERALAAAITRGAKDRELTPDYIEAVWNALAAEFEWGQEKIEAMRAAPAPARDPAELRATIRAAILERLWEEGPAISIGAVRSMAFELAPMGLGLEEANAVLEAMKRDGDLITLDGWQVTSREIRAGEEYVRKIAVKAAQREAPPLPAQAVARGIDLAEKALGGHELDPEQLEAVELLTRGSGWACLTGRAGTGKGPVLEAVAEAHRADGWRVVGCAVDGATAVRLGHQISAEPLSIDMLLYRARRGSVSIDDRTLVLIDEASKVGLRHWGELAKLCARTGLRIVPVGDVGQIGAIECPGMLDVMLKHEAIPTKRLDKVRRHRDPTDPTKLHPWLDQYQRAMYDHDAGAAIDILRAEDAITMHDTREEAMRGMVETWERRRAEHGIAVEKTMLVVHGTNEDVDEVNALAQEARVAAGEIVGDGVQSPDRTYRIYENDVVMVRGAAYQPEPEQLGAPAPPRVENGTVGIVDRVDEAHKRVWVTFDEPGRAARQVMMDVGDMRARVAQAGQQQGEQRTSVLRLAYAWHPFPAQGANRDYVGSLWGHHTQRNQETYSGDTRPVRFLDVHTDRESLGHEGTDDDRYERYAKRLSKRWHRQASITHEGTPETSIAVGITPSEQVPRHPARTEPVPDESVLDRSAEEAEATRVADPLEAYRDLLGPQRLAQLGAYADTLSDELDELDDAALRADRDQGRESLARLDRRAALETGRLERDQPRIAVQIDRALQQASALEAQAQALPGLRNRRERTELLEAAHAQRAVAERDQTARRALFDRELALRGDGAHPDQWVAAHGDGFARGVAAERQLALRQQIHIRDQADQAVRRPPQYIVDMIGPRPRDDAPERREWVAITRRLVRAQLVRGGELQPEPRDDDLESRIDALRSERGLEPFHEPSAPEQIPNEPEIGA